MSIMITTGDIRDQYEILDAIFAMDFHKEGFLSSADPEKAFDKVKADLKSKCQNIGGDAVVNCQFQYRVSVGTGMLGGAKQVIEIFAYGTAVRIIRNQKIISTKPSLMTEKKCSQCQNEIPLEAAFCPECGTKL